MLRKQSEKETNDLICFEQHVDPFHNDCQLNLFCMHLDKPL